MGILTNKEIMCPFCLEQVLPDSLNCPKCDKEISQSYKDVHHEMLPMVISAIGFSGHGKTIYLASLMYTLEKFSSIWPRFYKQALNHESLETVKQNVQDLRSGRLPEMTKQNFPIPSILCLNYVPSFSRKLMIIYDASGESFEIDSRIEKNASYVKKSQTVFFLISLNDLLTDEKDGKEPLVDGMRNLLNIYMLGIRRLGGSTKSQHLVVVYTKGDVLQQALTDYPKTWDYVNGSELEIQNWDMPSYCNNMRGVSEDLKDFTVNCLEAHEFYNMSVDNFMSVEYCLISALGNAPVDDKLANRISPRRVIDPLIWALYKSAAIYN